MRRSEAEPNRAAVEAPYLTMSERRRPLSRLAAVGGRTRISLLACLFALVLAGCGSDGGTIPENQSSDLLSLLDNVQSNAQSGDCDTASGFAQEFANRVDELPSDVDADVRDELDKAANNLDQLASDSNQCNAPEAGATGEGGFEPTTESSSTVEETTSTTTTEEPETTTTTTTTDEETPTQQPSDNQGQGGSGTTPPVTPPSSDQGQQGEGSGGGTAPPSGGVGAGGSAG